MTDTGILRTLLYSCILLVVLPFGTWELVTQYSTSDSRSLLDGGLLLSAAGVIAFSALRIVQLSHQLPERFVTTFFYIFIYIWLGLVPLYQLGIGQLSWRFVLPPEYYREAYFVIFVGLIAYEAAIRLPRETRGAHRNPNLRTPSISSIVVAVIIAVTLATWLGPLSTPLDLLMSGREDLADALDPTGTDRMSRLLSFTMMRTPIYIMFLVTLWRWRVDKSHQLVLGVLLVIMLPLLIVVNFPTAISRTWLGTIIASVALVLVMTSRKRSATFLPLGLICALLTIYPLAHYTRSAVITSHGDVSQSILATYSAGSFDAYSMVAHTQQYMDRAEAPISWGHQLLGPLFFWIPRSAWPSKPIGSGELIATELGFPFTNVSAPLWSEGMVNFGIIGVIALFSIFGFVSRALEINAASQTGFPTLTGMLFTFVAAFQFIILRGDLLTTSTLATPVIIILLTLFRGPWSKSTTATVR